MKLFCKIELLKSYEKTNRFLSVVCEDKKEDFSILLAVLQYIPSPPSGPTNYAKFFRKSCLDTPVSFFFCR